MKKIEKVFIYVQKSCNINLAMIKQVCNYLIENDYVLIKNPKNADLIIFSGCVLNNSRTGNMNDLIKMSTTTLKEKTFLSIGCISSDEKFRSNFRKVKFINIKKMELLDDILDTKIKFYKINYNKTQKAKDYFSKLIKNYPFKCKDKEKNSVTCLVSRGCLGNCSYCTDKIAIGNVKSREINDIVKEIGKQIKSNTKKIFLISDDCGCYGMDINTNFIELLKGVLKEFPKQKVSFYHLNPHYLCKHFEKYKKIFLTGRISSCSITMQSLSKRIIKLMNRHYDPKKAMEKIKKLKKISPQTKFTSHFLVGFPTETEKEFNQTMEQVDFFDKAVINLYERNIKTKSASLRQISLKRREEIITKLKKIHNTDITINI